MRIAVTGSTGMIGIALINVALEEGHEVTAIMRPGSKVDASFVRSSNLTTIECDISNYAKLTSSVKCDVLFHLAWDKTFGDGRDDVQVQMKNIVYTVDAVELAGRLGAKVFVGAGSQAEYGITNERLNGNTRTDPLSGYGIAKYSAGKMSKIKCKQLEIRFNWARILSVYGENDAPHSLTMHLIQTLLKKNVPELTRCEQIWDYIYSYDAAQALLAIGLRGKDGKTYCIGSGKERPLKDFVCDVRDAIDPSLELKFGVKDYYPYQPMMLCADIRELTEDTGFVPRYSFKEGIARTIEHFKDQSKRSSRSS